MKHIYRILFAMAAAMGFVGCSKSFLDTKQPSNISPEGFYKDSASVARGVIGAYNGLQGIFSGTNCLYLIGDVATDNSYTEITGSIGNWNSLAITEIDGAVSNMWTNIYTTINRANAVITFAPSITMNETAKAAYIAEAKFLRALCYFYAVRIWGKVPVSTQAITNPDATYAERRAEVEEVYDLIIADVTEAYNTLPAFYAQTDANAGRATKAAAIALWGEVLLTQKKYGEAVTKLAEIVNSPGAYNVSLLSGAQYENIFSPANEMNSEIIFAVRYKAGQNNPQLGSSFNNIFMPVRAETYTPPGWTTTLSVGAALSGNLVHPDLRNDFEENDLRKSATIDSMPSTRGMATYSKKYINPGATRVNDANNDWIVYRYADILLLYAEALNENSRSGDANNIVTRVRQRAGLLPLEYTDQADLRGKILHERRIELNLEGKRWFDLLRNNALISTLTAHFTRYPEIRGTGVSPAVEPFRLLFPVPSREIINNPKLAPNNPGYNDL